MLPDTKKKNNKTGWKIFFWIYAVITVAGMTIMLFLPETKWYESVLQFPLCVLVITGLYGFTYNQKYFTARIWLYVLFLSILSDLYHWYEILFTQDYGGMADLSYIIIVPAILAAVLLNLLPYLALYRYSLKSPEIWENEETTARQLP